MSFRPVLRGVGVTALGLLFAAAAALPAAAEPAAEPAGAPTASPQVLTAMRHDMGLSAGQVDERLAAEAAAAAAIPGFAARLGDSYAGAWVESGQLVVGTTDAAAVPAIESGGARAVVLAHDDGELDDVQVKLDEAAGAAAEAVGSWYVDVATNSVVVTATDRAAAESFVATADADADPVRIEVVPATPEPYADLVGGAAILARAGGRCSIGFSATSAQSGGTFVLTAGHCTELGGDWTGANGVLIGPVAATNFPGDDFGAIRVDNTAAWTATNEVAGAGPVTGAAEAAIGASVCRSGSTTGFRCGSIVAKNATVNYGGGDVVRGLTGTSACAERGDSGGSFVSGAQAQGVTSGGSGDCSTGGQTFFQPIGEALSTYGLTLVTS